MLKSIAGFSLAIILSVFTFETANADTVRCDLTRWRGATEDVAIAWVGIGFEAQRERSRVRIIDEDGMTGWTEVSARETSDYITFTKISHDTSAGNERLRNRYSFRIYNRGRCEVRMEPDGYLPIIGEGRIR